MDFRAGGGGFGFVFLFRKINPGVNVVVVGQVVFNFSLELVPEENGFVEADVEVAV